MSAHLSDAVEKTEETFLIDHSVWGRLATRKVVREAFDALIIRSRPTSLLVCPPTVAEYGFSARDAAEHEAIQRALTAFTECTTAPTSSDAMRIQHRLWSSGLVRAAGAFDTVIAAYAIANDATVLHYDRDFEHIAAAVPEFTHRWIVPRGSVD